MSTPKTPVMVLCAVLGPAEAEVVQTLEAVGVGTTVTRRCADLAELLAAAEAGVGSAAVVSATLPGLNSEAVTRLNQANVHVVALDTAPESSTDRLTAIGVNDLARTVDDLVPLLQNRDDSSVPTPSQGSDANGSGKIITVWGPMGGPGRTTTAIELAAALSSAEPDGVHVRTDGSWLERIAGQRKNRKRKPKNSFEQVILADADTYAPSVTVRLGILDESVGLAGAVQAAGMGPINAATLARCAPTALAQVRVLGGISRASRWPELSTSALDSVWERAREASQWTVIDTGPVLETDEMLTYDTRAPQRNAATLSALNAADLVVIVGTADPIGLQRLVRGLDELSRLPVMVTSNRHVVVNRVRAATVGERPEAAIHDVLARFAGVQAHLIPDDPAHLDVALRMGRALVECAPHSPAREAFVELADQIRAAVPASLAGGGEQLNGVSR